jgi:hypothetical protein
MQPAPKTKTDDGPGVPEAVPRTLQGVVGRLGVAAIDRIWVFPPLVRGRRESGLIALSCFAGPPAGAERRVLWTAPYAAERSGRGLVIDWTLVEQGEAPPDRFPRVMQGVVQRAAQAPGEPREVEIAGHDERWAEFLSEFEAELLLPPESPPSPPEVTT